MFSILIVEDEPRTLKQLETYLYESLPECQIHSALNVREARQLLQVAEQAGWAYDVAILDFRLPVSLGAPTEIDESVCHTIRLGSPETFVIHITAYPNDAQVTQHILAMHSGAGSPRTALVSKLEITWSRTLMQEVRTQLYSHLIRTEIAQLFGGVGEPGAGYPDTVSTARSLLGDSMTHELRNLLGRIVDHWADLDENLKKRINQYFNVVEPTDGGRIQISLL